MIWFSGLIFMQCFNNLNLIYINDVERSEQCFLRSVCVGSANRCKDFIPKQKEENFIEETK